MSYQLSYHQDHVLVIQVNRIPTALAETCRPSTGNGPDQLSVLTRPRGLTLIISGWERENVKNWKWKKNPCLSFFFPLQQKKRRMGDKTSTAMAFTFDCLLSLRFSFFSLFFADRFANVVDAVSRNPNPPAPAKNEAYFGTCSGFFSSSSFLTQIRALSSFSFF